jgi:hypothetical protein
MVPLSNAIVFGTAWADAVRANVLHATMDVSFVVIQRAVWCEDPIDFGEASSKQEQETYVVNRIYSRTLDTTGNLTAKKDKVVTRRTCRIALDFLFVMDTVLYAEGASAGTCCRWGLSLPRSYSVTS